MQELKPTQMPPSVKASGGSAIAGSQPRELTALELTNTGTAKQPSSVPTLTPPQSSGSGVTATWMSDQRINALWSINESRNVWVGVTNIGWKKLADNSDSAIMSLTILAAHARLAQTRYDYFEGDDGKIAQCYIW
jgi:hypothetical protein